MNKKRKMKKHVLSVPKSIYISVGVVCIVMILPQFFVNGNSNSGITQILANIGYSLLASDVAGVLFDLGNNFSKNKDDKKVYGSVTLGHSMLVSDIIIVAEYTCERLDVPNFDILSFDQQLKHVLYEGLTNDFIQTDDYIEAAEDVLNWLFLVRDSSKELLDISYIMYENKQFDEKKRTKLRLLRSAANEASEQFEKHTIDSNKKVYTLINRINTILINLYPEQVELLQE